MLTVFCMELCNFPVGSPPSPPHYGTKDSLWCDFLNLTFSPGSWTTLCFLSIECIRLFCAPGCFCLLCSKPLILFAWWTHSWVITKVSSSKKPSWIVSAFLFLALSILFVLITWLWLFVNCPSTLLKSEHFEGRTWLIVIFVASL